MKNYLIVVLLCLVSGMSAQAQKSCHLTRKIVSMEGRIDTTDYQYHQETGRLLQVNRPYMEGGQYAEKFNYGIEVLNSMESRGFSFLYFHDDANRINGVIDYDDLSVSHSFRTMEYDAEGRLIRYTTFETPFMEDTLVAEFSKFSYEGEKMVKHERFENYPDSNSAPSMTILFEYTDKKNPEYNPLCFPFQPKLLVAKEVHDNLDGIYEDFSHTRVCKYNAEGYPVKCTLKYINGSDKGVEEYFYECK
jgi:hypothetical protein